MFTDTISPTRRAPRFLAGASLAAALLLSACATPTPYQPLTRGAQASGGYSEQRLEDNRFRVTFRGNSLTSREQVENYLLFRASELTLQSGYDGFTMVTRATDPRTRTSVSSYGPYGPGPWGYWGPSWRYYGGYGWRHWDPWGPDPFWADSVDVRTVTSFEASAEIVMFRGRRPNDPQSVDARQVIANLGPRISYPRDSR